MNGYAHDAAGTLQGRMHIQSLVYNISCNQGDIQTIIVVEEMESYTYCFAIYTKYEIVASLEHMYQTSVYEAHANVSKSPLLRSKL